MAGYLQPLLVNEPNNWFVDAQMHRRTNQTYTITYAHLGRRRSKQLNTRAAPSVGIVCQ
jgi:hypothetical protein